MMLKPVLGGVLLGLCVAGPLLAQTVYKSVDEQGNVTYSAEPPKQSEAVERVKLPPGPTPAERSAAEQRAKEIDQAADKAESSRTAGESARNARIEAAEKQVELAKQRLEAAKEVGPGDRTGTASGGSRLNESYWERVRKAESALEEAQAALKAAKAGR